MSEASVHHPQYTDVWSFCSSPSIYGCLLWSLSSSPHCISNFRASVLRPAICRYVAKASVHIPSIYKFPTLYSTLFLYSRWLRNYFETWSRSWNYLFNKYFLLSVWRMLGWRKANFYLYLYIVLLLQYRTVLSGNIRTYSCSWSWSWSRSRNYGQRWSRSRK